MTSPARSSPDTRPKPREASSAPPDRRQEPLGTRLDSLVAALRQLHGEVPRIERWGSRLAAVLASGGRLLACGNGGSAAEAQHLTAELVGRYVTERQPLAAMPLHADTSSATAIINDYGADHLFARQVQAHARPGDILLCLSTSGRSRNVLAAAHAARERAMVTWALTGPLPNTLAECCDDTIAVPAAETATVQEVHLAAIHLLCAAVDRSLPAALAPPGDTAGPQRPRSH